ncbi:uncharacterized protein LOC143277634 [Babylonia areolata]|uniref:uncharacterized protein LOC143277634 n=1 Tax=Babylonia areolata TaxID=304850 RepID=UPI003FD0CC7E
MMAGILIQIMVALSFATVVGIIVNDNAHAAQEVIFAADWSQFSDRLLTKVQLFSSRLCNSRIGYGVYGLFVIDRSTVLMMVGTLVTYTVVVVQFQQSEVSVHHGNVTMK